MRLRLMFGPVLIAFLLGLMWLDSRLDSVHVGSGWGILAEPDGTLTPGLPVLLVGLGVCARAGYELRQMFAAKGLQASAKSLPLCASAGLLAGVLTIGGRAPVPPQYAPALLATAAAGAVFLPMLAFLRRKTPQGAAGAIAAAITTFTYVGVMLAFLMAVRREYAVWVMVMVVLTIKACDSGAYFTGKAIGKHKMIPWLSPGKTWEGLAGGLVSAALCGLLFQYLAGQWGPSILQGVPTWKWMVFGVLLGGFGQLGDLSASVFKRDAGIKDSGSILPGFGGVIDMLDSLLLTGPVAYWLLHAIRSS
ncbi:MAG TPA: phosphatidate cytidylyltransferase [Phycisphaerales bacterium]|nr:phosphatidate cytidylyltransferase [Phycisphaerales bacterium]